MKRRSIASSSPADPGRRERPPGRSASSSIRVPETPSQVEEILDALGVEPTRGWGQNFLVDREVARLEAALVDLPPGRPVVEIGGGLGLLTAALLERGFHPLTVLEREPRFAAFLATNFGSRIHVREADALVDPLPRADAYVGNLPFSTATPILERLLEEGIPHGVFLVQREVGERLAATAGSRQYGKLSVMSAIHGSFRLADRVPARMFHPVPRVDGVLTVFRRHPMEPPPEDRGMLERLLAGLFAQRRKMLGNTLPPLLEELLPHVPAAEVVSEAGWPEDWARRRAEEISPEDLVRLSNLLVRPEDSRADPSPVPGSSRQG